MGKGSFSIFPVFLFLLCINSFAADITVLDTLDASFNTTGSISRIGWNKKRIVIENGKAEITDINLPFSKNELKRYGMDECNNYGWYKTHGYLYSIKSNEYKSFFPKDDYLKLEYLVSDTESSSKWNIIAALGDGAITPDGQIIYVFKCPRPDRTVENIYAYDTPSFTVQPLLEKPLDVWAFYPEVSPDGKKIAFYGGPKGTYKVLLFCDKKYEHGFALYTFDIETKEIKQVTDFGSIVPDNTPTRKPMWSEDGKYIIFQNNYNHPSGVFSYFYYVESTGGKPIMMYDGEDLNLKIDKIKPVDNENFCMRVIDYRGFDENNKSDNSPLILINLKTGKRSLLAKAVNVKQEKNERKTSGDIGNFFISEEKNQILIIFKEEEKRASKPEDKFSPRPDKLFFTSALYNIEDLKKSPAVLQDKSSKEKLLEKSLLKK